MIELNLLPREFKKKRKKLALPEIPIIPILACFIGALILIQLFLSGLLFISRKQLTGLEKTWKNLAPKKAELDKIKREIASGTRVTSAIDGLIEEQPNWARLLNELSNSLTPNIWITELVCEEKNRKIPARNQKKQRPTSAKKNSKKRARPDAAKQAQPSGGMLTISGFATGLGEETTANVARFIRSLKDNRDFFRDFADVELVSMKKSVVEERDVMNFTLACERRSRGKEE